MTYPGLVSRKIISRDGEMVTIEEVWDVTVDGCPLIVMRPDVAKVKVEIKMHERAYAEIAEK